MAGDPAQAGGIFVVNLPLQAALSPRTQLGGGTRDRDRGVGRKDPPDKTEFGSGPEAARSGRTRSDPDGFRSDVPKPAPAGSIQDRCRLCGIPACRPKRCAGPCAGPIRHRAVETGAARRANRRCGPATVAPSPVLLQQAGLRIPVPQQSISPAAEDLHRGQWGGIPETPATGD